jgi:hypothetical protein
MQLHQNVIGRHDACSALKMTHLREALVGSATGGTAIIHASPGFFTPVLE